MAGASSSRGQKSGTGPPKKKAKVSKPIDLTESSSEPESEPTPSPPPVKKSPPPPKASPSQTPTKSLDSLGHDPEIKHHLGIISAPEHATPISPEPSQAPPFVEQTMPPEEPTTGETEADEPSSPHHPPPTI
ncbi:hypothetical protein AAG906_012690 [Vitis piasezkii]